MNEASSQKITIELQVFAPLEKVWEYWTRPEHIVQWSHASPGWTTPFAENDMQVGGKLRIAFGSPDHTRDFVVEGTYSEIDEYKYIAYTLDDERLVQTYFEDNGESIRITQTFDAETENSTEQQREGWMSILKNFRNYTESL